MGASPGTDLPAMRPAALLLSCLLLSSLPACVAPEGAAPSAAAQGGHSRLLPYADLSYPMARAVQETLGERAALGLALRATRQHVRTDDVALWLAGEHDRLPLAARADGVFLVPVIEHIAREGGQFLVNKGEGEVSVNLVLVPTLARDSWTMGAVRALLADARGGLGKHLPWYRKPVLWVVTRKLALAVCSRMRGTELVLREGERVVATLPALEELRNHAHETVFCRRLEGNEGYAPATRLVIPDDAEVLLL